MNEYHTEGDITFIGLTQHRIAIIDTVDLDTVLEFQWCFGQTSKSMNYVVSPRYTGSGKSPHTRYLHRVLAEKHFGTIPSGFIVDHINGETLDNRISSNLRILSHRQNIQAARLRKCAGYVGVHQKAENRFAARIVIDGKAFTKRFDTPEEAAMQYDQWSVKSNSFYAESCGVGLNFPEKLPLYLANQYE